MHEVNARRAAFNAAKQPSWFEFTRLVLVLDRFGSLFLPMGYRLGGTPGPESQAGNPY